VNSNYEDIILLPHHVSRTRKRMSAIERAAQFSPFAALTGFDAAIQECGRLTDSAVELEEDEKKLLNDQMAFLAKYQFLNPEITVNYFRPDSRKRGGKYVTVTGNIQKIDASFQRIFLTDSTVISFDRIRWIQSPMAGEQEHPFSEGKKRCIEKAWE